MVGEYEWQAADNQLSITESKKEAFMRKFFTAQNIEFSFDRIGIKALSGMAQGLFASLLIGTILGTLGTLTGIELLSQLAVYCREVQGAAMGVAIAYALQAPPFVLFSAAAVGHAASMLGGAGGPLAVYFVVLFAVFCGKLVSKRTPVDLIVTPAVTIVSGVAIATLIAPPVGAAASAVGNIIMWATEMQPFIMGILISLIIGIALTLPISSAAICAALGLVGLAGGAALAGCCAHMVGFAVCSFRENGVGGLASQGIGTSMLQLPNLLKKPILWVPPVVASVINGPVATVLFNLKMNGSPISSGMGTCGLVGPIGVISGWFSPSEAALLAGEVAKTPGALDYIGLLVIVIIIPAAVSLLVSELMRKAGAIKQGDYTLKI